MSTPVCFRYWGKAQPGEAEEVDHHPLPYHSLDVAAVGSVVLRRHPSYLSTISKLLACPPEQAARWLVWLLAIHDLGKFAGTFQGLRPDLFRRLQPGRRPMVGSERHDALGTLIFQARVVQELRSHGVLAPHSGHWLEQDDGVSALSILVDAVVGHHGKPSATSARLAHHFDHLDCDAAIEFADLTRTLLLGASEAFPAIDPVDARRASWWIAGLAVLCDWVGSNQRLFPYESHRQELVDYWHQQALKRAEVAVTACGIIPPMKGAPLNFGEMFPGAGFAATPLQSTCATVALAEHPQIFVLEDVTGAGKTEAAIMLAHRLLQEGLGNGIYFGLPTMATANAMYHRIAAVYRHLFVHSSTPSMVMAHAGRTTSDAFLASLVTGSNVEDYGDATEPAGARCAAWLGDNAKKSTLADIGVGTIDQALLAVLSVRHQSLRMLGLAHKVLVVDEVHACDAYMQEVLKVLLKAHAMAGGSAILLSATLPDQHRLALVTAFASGCGSNLDREARTEQPYPLLTTWHRATPCVLSTPVGMRESVRRTVCIESLNDVESAICTLEAAVERGAAACWIRNTVDDAIDAYQRLRERHPNWPISLFHARFTAADRQNIEEGIFEWFGPASTPEDRRGRLVIATQVVEQSLDVDFDVMVSDLAPIDLLIQRAGRLQRHCRDLDGARSEGPDERGAPLLHVLTPPARDDDRSDWLARLLPGTPYVYRDLARLWLTARWIENHGSLRMPDDARGAIEHVYGPPDGRIAAGLEYEAVRAAGERGAASAQGRMNTLDLEAGYCPQGSNFWWDDTVTPTRLGEPTETLYLGTDDGSVIRPWHHDTGSRAWLASAVKVRSSLLRRAGYPSEVSAERLATAHPVLPAATRYGRVTVLAESAGLDGLRVGTSTDARLAYSGELGLTVTE